MILLLHDTPFIQKGLREAVGDERTENKNWQKFAKMEKVNVKGT